jgi:hypothetical protein
MNDETKVAVTVAEMARMVGLSRQRLYQLMGTTFPFPLYDAKTRRPFYPTDLQQVCLEVRRRNFGINGKPVMFYCIGHRPRIQRPVCKRKPTAKKKQFVGLMEGLTTLGLVIPEKQVAEAVKHVFPNGVESRDQGEVLKAVFLHIKRQDSGDNVGR